MKWTIENKILVPFVLLVLVSQVTLLGTSFRNDYKLIINNQYRSMDAAMMQLERSLAYQLDDDGLKAGTNQEMLISIIQTIMEDKIIILDRGGVLLNETELESEQIDHVISGQSGGFGHADTGKYLLCYHRYEPLNWILITVEEKEALLSTFYESYKYNILTGIIFLTLSLQITVFVAAHITKPVKRLVKFCMNTSSEERDKRIILDRRDEIGQLGGAFNAMLDELDASLVELTQVKKYNENILNSIEKGIITLDSRGRVMSENPCARSIVSTFKGSTLDGGDLLDAIKKRLPQHGDFTGVDEILEFGQPGGLGLKYLDLNISIMHDDSGRSIGYICSFSDVTERKRLESRIYRLERLATAGRLASGVAHEVRNPLTGMKTSVQVLRKRLRVHLEENNERIFDRIIKEIDRINKLVSDLLGYTRSSGSEPLLINAADCIHSILDLLEVELDEQDIEVRHDKMNEDIHFFMDADQLKQILMNLIKNAMEAVEKGGVIEISATWCTEDPTRGEIRIKDNGRGIGPDQLNHVFDPFYTTKNEGTGLGLSIVHELVHQNDGEIGIESLPEQGTCVMLKFNVGDEKYE